MTEDDTAYITPGLDPEKRHPWALNEMYWTVQYPKLCIRKLKSRAQAKDWPKPRLTFFLSYSSDAFTYLVSDSRFLFPYKKMRKVTRFRGILYVFEVQVP